MVHRLRDPCDVDEAFHHEVESLAYQPHDGRELDELRLLRRPQWVCFEERKNPFLQVTEGPDAKAVQILLVVVVSTIAADVATCELEPQLVQYVHAPLSLDHAEVRLNLPAEATASVPENWNAEASFAVDKADDPLLETWPFLLIVRTERFVTAHATQPKKAV